MVKFIYARDVTVCAWKDMYALLVAGRKNKLMEEITEIYIEKYYTMCPYCKTPKEHFSRNPEGESLDLTKIIKCERCLKESRISRYAAFKLTN